MTQTWFQGEFFSDLDKSWIPLFGRHSTIESAREARGKIKKGIAHIVQITRTVKEIE